MAEILVVDDDLRMRQLIEELMRAEGHTVFSTGDSRDALLLLKERSYDVVITDLKMPHVGGLEVLSYAKEADPGALVIMVTAHGTVESAIEAIRKGAYDYIQKPFEPDHLLLLVERSLEHSKLLKENKRLSAEVMSFREDDLIGSSRGMTAVRDMIEKVAPLDTTVLIQGETGTGKELIARLLHRRSARSGNVFLPLNCGALSETLLESELFGHEKGAFTGALHEKKGVFETANGGTIFLDEINATSPAMQVKLLRVLQEQTIMRVGSAKPVSVNVRVLAASNANLSDEVSAGRFRKDLFYRLNVVVVNIPSLRERKDDIPLLAYHFLNKYSRKFDKDIASFSPEVLEISLSHQWPGNVRELENVIERAVIMEPSSEINAASLPPEIRKSPFDPLSHTGLMTLEEMEKFLIQRTLRILDGQKNKAAEALGIDVTTLWRKLKKYGLE
ncbi:MAG: sigma-54-dependent Fis family transcriptional regulator [Nitrospirae bacterium]|nr:MAG: sigma-54-dependent Fis family transcriptional regulator [Nitrospirota bacterium]